MCGIGGILGFWDKPVKREMVERLNAAIPHRGPNGAGVWINVGEQAGLGHLRLSIIDLSENGRQPMHYLERYSLTFNGEIYNYLELKEDLLKKGYCFSSSSDTEVLLALFDLKKEKCLKDLDGMFSFAIWDEKEKVLFCARDRFGEKPFYYSLHDGFFSFASEMKQLWNLGVPRIRDEEMLKRFLVNGNFLSDPSDPGRTFYKGIRKLEKSHFMFVKTNGEIKSEKYWDINCSEIPVGLEKASEQFLRLLTTSVKRRLRSDVAVGSSLSGGLDSSAIVCLIDKIKEKNGPVQKTFSARFRDFEKDEGAYMQKVIDACDIEAHFTWPDEVSFREDFKSLAFHQEEPFGSASIFAQWCVMKLARQQNVTVLLDGQGADEMLAGYRYYFGTYFNELFIHNPRKFTTEAAAYEKLHGVPAWHQAPVGIQYHLKNIVRPLYDMVRTKKTGEFRSLNEHLYYSTMGHGLEDLLRFADRNSMAHSREIRLPFLSHELVEFVFTLPPDLKIREGWTKFLLRNSMQDILPQEIAWRKDKIGYEPPQARWMKDAFIGNMIRDAYETLEKERIFTDGSISRDNKEWQVLVAAQTLFN